MSDQNNHTKFMHRAIELADQGMAAGAGGPFGAVVVRNGEIIAEGFNKVTSTHDPTAHAEVTVIRAACAKLKTFQLDDCILYTSCEPCPMCFGAIYWARFEKVYYGAGQQDAAKIGFDDQFIYDEIDKPIGERTISFEQLAREDAVGVFDKWEGKIDRIDY